MHGPLLPSQGDRGSCTHYLSADHMRWCIPAAHIPAESGAIALLLSLGVLCLPEPAVGDAPGVAEVELPQ